MNTQPLNLCLRILDDQLVDAEDERFGRIDDIELDGAPGRETHVRALIVGAGAWRWRVPTRLASSIAALTPNIVRRIPWDLVQAIEPGVVRISTTSGELGFRTAHHVGAAWVDELEQATLRVSSLLAIPLVGRGGETLGRVHEVRAEMEGTKERPGPVSVEGVLAGKPGWRARLAGSGSQGAPSDAVDWSRLRMEDARLVVDA